MCYISNLSSTFDINGPNSLSKAQRKEGTKRVFSLIYIANAYGFAVCTLSKISVCAQLYAFAKTPANI